MGIRTIVAAVFIGSQAPVHLYYLLKHYPYLRRHQYFLVSLLGLAIFLGVVFTAVSSETAITWAALGVLLGSIVLHWIELWLSWSRNAQGLHLLLIAIAFIIAVSLLLSLWRDFTVSNAVLFFVVSLVAMLVTIIISAQARAAGRDRKDQEAHQEKCRALGIARGRKEAQKDAARRRIGALDNAEIARRSEQLLDNLYHTMVRGSDQFIDITDMAQEGDEVGDIWFLARRLAALGDIKVSNSDDAGWTEILELTAQGFNRAATAGDPASRAEVSIGRLINMGDFIQAGPNSTVINRSLLSNSLNKVRNEVGGDMADAINAVAEEVQKSHDADAIELFDEFNRELQSDTPRKSMLRVLFDGITKAAPAINSLTDATTKIAGLFS